ncbi:hypothetical protein F4141_21765 [Candidatus Poribacteria bacterium]|nr:hypothetical protein [Candidatus Poribacteria bacterium]MYH83315.1 hypothetical protein [Candidatus Poribacteria bacterium]
MTKTDDIPEATLEDRLHTLAKAGIASIPVVGAAASELFAVILASPLEKRRIEWMNDVAEHLKELEERGELNLEDLQDNETFITTVMQASQAAIRNHQSEKREVLRNAVLNAALPNAPEESIQQLFINQVATFTVWHIRLLDLFKDSPAWFEKNGVKSSALPSLGNLEQLITTAWPDLKNQEDFLNAVVQELEAKGLFKSSGLLSSMSLRDVYDKKTTKMGDAFLEFITAP